ncbi:hypothetical protein BH24DEI2_BH24DEI2_16820 [soil metagenome]
MRQQGVTPLASREAPPKHNGFAGWYHLCATYRAESSAGARAHLLPNRGWFMTFLNPDLVALVATISYLGVFLIVLLETGVLLGFFLPGDSLLVTVGLLAAAGQLELLPALAALFFGSVVGNNLGFWWGRRLGPALSAKVRADRLAKAQVFYDKLGWLAIVVGPFLPIVRTLVPFLSGASGMPWRRFFAFNLLGSLLWTQGLTLAGYFLGRAVPDVERYFLVIIAGVVVFAFVPYSLHYLLSRRREVKS